MLHRFHKRLTHLKKSSTRLRYDDHTLIAFEKHPYGSAGKLFRMKIVDPERKKRIGI